jgi:hypothetical protein
MFNRVISYHLVQLLVSALLVALIPALREPSKVLFISYWLVTAITLAGYWVAHCKNVQASWTIAWSLHLVDAEYEARPH